MIGMKTINNLNAMKALKVFHILFGIMWIGGVMALVSIMLGVQPQGVEQMYAVARDHLVIDKFFLIPGGADIRCGRIRVCLQSFLLRGLCFWLGNAMQSAHLPEDAPMTEVRICFRLWP